MGQDDDPGPRVAQLIQGGQGGTDSTIIGDVLVTVQRHVEIAANTHTLTGEVSELGDRFH